MHTCAPTTTADEVEVFFVASPLQYLAALSIAGRGNECSRKVLIWYKHAVTACVKAEDWDASAYMPWPRFEPLPGPFGRHRRLRANIRLVARLIGQCATLTIHSAVFDTEAINYFLAALPQACGAQSMRARILPDGLISIRRYPLTWAKRFAQHLRGFRRLFAPELRFTAFSGDRIGSDAPFCDRIYVLPGLPHEYPAEKVVVLPSLVRAEVPHEDVRRALVVGQPLAGAGLMRLEDVPAVSDTIRDWLARQGITDVHYKQHPKDPNRELDEPGYELIESEGPLELYMSLHPYSTVVGVRSSALIFAKQIYGARARVLAFGWERILFKSPREEADMRQAFIAAGVEFYQELPDAAEQGKEEA